MDQTMTPVVQTKPTPKLYQTISLIKAKKLSQQLNKFLQDNNLVMEIAGKKYIQIDGWEFLGTQLGLTQIIVSCDPIAPTEDLKEIKYRAEVEIINQSGTIVSRGFAWCSNKEKKKTGFEEYAVASMAQTRAIGKAYRNILSWIVKMGGYEATPYEEVDKDKMETDLAKAKQKLVPLMNEKGLKTGTQMIGFIEKTIGKGSIDNIDEANQVLRALNEQDQS